MHKVHLEQSEQSSIPPQQFLHIQAFPNRVGFSTFRVCGALSVYDTWEIGGLNLNATGTHQKDTSPPCLLALLHSTNS